MRLDHLLSMENVKDAESTLGNRVEQRRGKTRDEGWRLVSGRKILIVVQFSVTDDVARTPSKGV